MKFARLLGLLVAVSASAVSSAEESGSAKETEQQAARQILDLGGQAFLDLKNAPSEISKEIVLVWNQTDRRIITGSDVLGLLFKGV